MKLLLLPEKFSIFKLEISSDIPENIISSKGPYSISCINGELSIICKTSLVPNNVVKEAKNWRMLRLDGEFGFEEIGILKTILDPLAKEKIPLLAISSYQTDHIMVTQDNLTATIATLKQHEHTIESIPSDDVKTVPKMFRH